MKILKQWKGLAFTPVAIAICTLAFFLTNRPSFFVNYEPSIPLDYRLPFIKEFALFYVSWFVALGVMPIVMFFINRKTYYKLLAAYVIGCVSAAVFYIFFQSDSAALKSDLVLNNDPFSYMMSLIFGLDKSYNALPSTHCISSMVFGYYYFKERKAAIWIRIAAVVWMTFICLSTVFVKQHYLLDVPAAVVFVVAAVFAVEPGLLFLKKKLKRADRREQISNTIDAEPSADVCDTAK